MPAVETDESRQAGFEREYQKAPEARAPLKIDATVTMVNGTFLDGFNWEKLAGQTWSTRPFCRPVDDEKNRQLLIIILFFRLARLSLQ